MTKDKVNDTAFNTFYVLFMGTKSPVEILAI